MARRPVESGLPIALATASRLNFARLGMRRRDRPDRKCRRSYRNRRQLFAAEFVGLANILRARVVSAERGTLNVELAPGFVVKREAHEAHAPGDVVDIVIRPEDIDVRAEAMDGDNTFPAKLKKAFFLGNIADIIYRDIWHNTAWAS